MINHSVRIKKGSIMADPAQVPPAWVTIERDRGSGKYLIVAETTGVYYSTDDEAPGVVATNAMFLPRDDSLVLEMKGGDKFHYWIPAGGTLRAAEVELLAPGDPEPRF